MSFTNIAKALPTVTLDTATLSEEEFIPFNMEGLGEASFIIRIINNSTTDVEISYENEDLQDFLPGRGEGSTFPPQTLEINLYPSGTSKGYCAFPKGKVIWVRGTPGTGNIYLSAYYQERI